MNDYITACYAAGVIGSSFAVCFALQDIECRVYVTNEDRKTRGSASIEAILDSLVQIEAITEEKRVITRKRILVTTDPVEAFIDRNDKLLFCGFEDIVNIHNIASNDNMISINAAISVDLTGQVCAESVGHREYSGTGGQLDFVRGASLSKGGCSFIAIPSTTETRNGRVSRIVLDLIPGSIITTPRTDVQYVVTEYGCVNLMFSNVEDRVKKLISIAHPDYRKDLLLGAKKAGLII